MNCWLAAPARQVHWCTAAPSAVDTPAMPRNFPLCWFTTVKVLATQATGRNVHNCWFPPSQGYCCATVPSAVLRLVSSRHCWECCATSTYGNLSSAGGSTVTGNVSSTAVCGRVTVAALPDTVNTEFWIVFGPCTAPPLLF